jgi:hypothetical protein
LANGILVRARYLRAALERAELSGVSFEQTMELARLVWTVLSMHAIFRAMSYRTVRMRAITVRVPEARLKQVMRARRIASHSELFNTLLKEEVEKLAARKALEATAGRLTAKGVDDRLL